MNVDSNNRPDYQILSEFLLKETSDIAVFFADLNGRITVWSPGVERLLGYTEDEFLGQDARIIFTPEDREKKLDEQELERARRDGRASDTRWHLKKDGERIFVDGVLSAIRDQRGVLRGYGKIIRNVFPDRVQQRVATTIVEGTPDAISVKDHERQFAFVNKRMAEILGRPVPEVLGRTLEEFQPAEISAPIYEDDTSVMLSGVAHIREEGLIVEGHGVRTFLSAKAPLHDLKGRTIGVVSILQDITARKQYEEERERLVRELRRSNEDLAQFSYVVSHDLQAPLRLVRSYAELLAKQSRKRLDESGNQFIDVIIDGARTMEQLIKDLLSFAQIGEGALKLTKVDMNAILAGVQVTLEPLINEKSADVTSRWLPTVLGDALQLTQLLQNLIGNAVKYSSPGIRPSIEVGAEELSAKEYQFYVRDNGIGIAPADRERIFSPLKRLHGAEVPGTGMGLAICLKIVERHGGTIWVESEPGQGSIFHFTLPSTVA
jgi:PAS domain S-box-containing protein